MVAGWYLRCKFYRVLDRRYRTPVGEIDLIVRRGRTIAFVEVKQRASAGAALEAVRATGRKRIARAAAHWLAAHPAAAGYDLRFDVMVAIPRRGLRHLEAVFDVEGNPW